jgi:hypothetical protein
MELIKEKNAGKPEKRSCKEDDRFLFFYLIRKATCFLNGGLCWFFPDDY